MRRIIQISVAFLFIFVVGCEESLYEWKPYSLKEQYPSEKAFSGVWIIDKSSLTLLRNMGYSLYTNETNHVLHLNADGTGVFRGYGRYWSIKDKEDKEIEITEYECMVGASVADVKNRVENIYNREDIEKYPSYYEILDTFPYIIGPYAYIQISDSCTLKRFGFNYYTHWRLYKRGESVPVDRYNEPYDWIYKIVLEHPENGKNRKGCETDFFVGKDGKGIFLYIPAYLDNKSNPIWYGIIFRRVKG